MFDFGFYCFIVDGFIRHENPARFSGPALSGQGCEREMLEFDFGFRMFDFEFCCFIADGFVVTRTRPAFPARHYRARSRFGIYCFIVNVFSMFNLFLKA
jgi:hypothetical protein